MGQHDPADCWVCSRHAIGVGVGLTNPRDKDPKWLCKECIMAIDDLTRIRRPSAYELKAREGGMDAAAPLVEQYGSDLAEWSEEQVLMFVGTVWRGCADRMRELVRDGAVPF